MNLSKKREPLIKRKERIAELMLPYQQELEFIDAQLALIDEYEKAKKETIKSDEPSTPAFLKNKTEAA